VEITEVKVYPRESDRKLRAYATLTFDNAFVVRDLRVIEGRRGLFVAMPSRKHREGCPRCNYKNVVGSKFCNKCGTNLEGVVPSQRPGEQREEHRDIAHPITTEAREYIQKTVLAAYEDKIAPAVATTVEEAPSQE